MLGLAAVSGPAHAADPYVPPAPAARATPIAGGAGLSWSNPGATSYTVYRRADIAGSWTEIATVPQPYNGSPRVYLDTTIPPGGSAQYAVSGVSGGQVGPKSSPVTATRPLNPTVPAANSLIATSDATGDLSTVSTTDGWVINGFGGEVPYVSSWKSGESPRSVYLSPVGPGTYAIDETETVRAISDLRCGSSLTPGDAFTTLIVRDALYDVDLTPLVLDATIMYRCPDSQTTQQLELRFHTDAPRTHLSASPVAVAGGLRHVGSPSAPHSVSLSNDGPADLNLGTPTILGAAADWTPATGTCTGELASGESCTLSVVFEPTADRKRNATLAVPTAAGSGTGPQFLVPLTGVGAGAPAAPSVNVTGAIDRLGVHVYASWDDGGYPATSFAVERRIGNGPFVPVGSVPATIPVYTDTDVSPGITYVYRATATNEIGTGPASKVEGSTSVNYGQLADREIVVISAASGQPAGVYALGYYGLAAIEADGHEHSTPAVSWGGTRMAFSRAVQPGTAPSDHDLWSRPVSGTGPSTKITSLAGSETQPAFSPNGRMIAFTSKASLADPAPAPPSVWVVPADGSAAPTKVGDGLANPTWRADGRSLVVEDTTDVTNPLVQIDVTTKARSQVPGTAGGTQPAVSRTGKLVFVTAFGRLAYGTNAGVLYPDPVNPEQNPPAENPGWRSDGALFYSQAGMIVAVEGSGSSGQVSPSDEFGDRDPAPVLVDTTAPTAGITAPSPSQGRVPVAIGPDDNATPPAGLTMTCAVDSSPPVPCGPTWTTPQLASGTRTIRVTVTDEAGNVRSVTKSVVVDRNAPTITTPYGPKVFVTAGKATFRYGGSDSGSGVRSYDVRYRSATARSGFPATYVSPDGWTRRASTSVTLTMKPGREYCVSVRSRDAAGNVSRWSADRCSAAPVDDRALRRGAGWKRDDGQAYFVSTSTAARRAGATLTYKGATARRIAVVGTTCSRCGKVAVYVGSRRVGTASFVSRSVRDRYVITVRSGGAPLTGKVRLVVLSGTPRIDGLGLRRT